MKQQWIVPNLAVPDIDAARAFYADYLGLTTEEFNPGWVARFSTPDLSASVQLVTRDATAPEDSVMTIRIEDVDAAYVEAQRLGYDVVHPLTTEDWGVRRFFARVGRQRHQRRRAQSGLT